MKSIAGKLTLATALLIIIGGLPLAATTGQQAEAVVDGITCATPPVKPAKKDTTRAKKDKPRKDKKQKSKREKHTN